MAEVRAALPADIQDMSLRMRDIDRREAELMTGLSPESALERSAEISKVWAGTWDGRLVCLFGVAKRSILSSDQVLPWLCATDELNSVARPFLRANRALLPKLLDGASLAYGYVLAENKSALRWLRWLGFKIADEASIRGAPFLRFEMRV